MIDPNQLKPPDDEDDLQRVLANTPWSALLIPLVLGIGVVIVTIILVATE